MKFITYVNNKNELNEIHRLVLEGTLDKDLVEVIVSTRTLNRYSEGSFDELMELISLNQAYKLKLLLEWDVLKQESLFNICTDELKKLPLHEFSAIRVQDPGALHYVKENFPWLKIQLILENGNHNFTGLERWKNYLGNQLDRLILSNELSRDHLQKYAKDLNVPIEILVFGRILLFYTPRNLLSALNKETLELKAKQKNIEAFGTSEESPHAGFPLIENAHGTFMFNVKDLYLMEHLDELRELNIGAVRADLRFDETFKFAEDFAKVFSGKMNHSEMTIKKTHPRPAIKGFYNINKTDVLFTKLKNRRIQRQDENYIGEIVDVERDEQLTLIVKSSIKPLSLGEEILIVTPEGKNKTLTVTKMLNSKGIPLATVTTNEIVLLPFLSGIVAKSQVYRK